MTHDEAFLQAIIENHDDDTPRLVYADWLEERGDPRGEFIRVQCELAKMVLFNDRRRQLQARQHELLGSHGTDWLTHDWPHASNPTPHARTFDRGFVTELSLHGRNLGDAGVQALAHSARLALLTSLDLSQNGIGEPGIQALADSPFLVRLVFLDLRDNAVDWCLRPLAASRHLPSLRELAVSLETTYAITAPDFSESLGSETRFDPEKAARVQALFRGYGKDVAIRN